MRHPISVHRDWSTWCQDDVLAAPTLDNAAASTDPASDCRCSSHAGMVYDTPGGEGAEAALGSGEAAAAARTLAERATSARDRCMVWRF
jgi:hypothetical protein